MPGGQGHELTGWYVDPLGIPAPREQGADLVPDGPALDAFADLEHPPGALQPQIGRRTRRRVVVPLPLQEVGPVDGRRDDLDDDVPRSGGRVRDLLPGELVRPTRLPHDDRPHAPSLAPVSPHARLGHSRGASRLTSGSDRGRLLRGNVHVPSLSPCPRSSPTTPSVPHGTRCSPREGVPRETYDALFAALEPLGASDLRFRAEQLSRLFTDRGVTFAHAGEERPFPLDLLPRIIDGAEWDQVVRGVRQRIKALEAFLADLYGKGEVFTDGVMPRRVVVSGSQLRREAYGIEPPNGVRIHVGGVDLIRDEQGAFRVLEDNLRVPSGVSYVIENRRAMTQLFPGLFATHRVYPVDQYPARLLAALRAAAPAGVTDPEVVVLTPGVYNAAYFEHALLARLMGVELVEGRDLVCSGNRVRMRTTQGERPVHVVYRRIDDEYLDPLHFRSDSVLGPPGILNAARAGNVTIANAVGNGAADDKLVYTYVPDLIRYYLGEEPVLDNVETHRLEDPETLQWVLSHLRRARAQAGRRRRRQGHRHRAVRRGGAAARPPPDGERRPARLDRAAPDRAVDGADADR